MKLFKLLTTFISALVLATLLGCASTAKQEGTGEYIDDTVITTKVKAEIFWGARLEICRDQRRNLQGDCATERLCQLAGQYQQSR